jgi:serine/threonine protein kinase
MEIYCTRPGCSRPQNVFAELDNKATLQTAQQKYCTSCGMPLILAGRYIPSKLLGQGGFGAAFLARDRYTPRMRDCVVKQFQPAGDLSPQQLTIAQNLFEREAEVLEQLGSSHPQIPDLYAFFPLSVHSVQGGKEEQFFYLVQEFIDGQTLEEELNTNGPFSEDKVLEVLREIIKVLKFVHDNGSIHRDIKLSNIIRHKNGLLYLLDFGAVKQVTRGAGGNQANRSTGIYSIGFAPPEQMSGSQVFQSTDLYALAVTAIVLLTGKNPEDLYDSFNNGWEWKNYAQVSQNLANVLDRMLLSSPNQRFQSAQDALDALTAQSASPPLSSFPSTLPAVTQPPNNNPTPIPTPPIHRAAPNQSPQPLARQSNFSLLEILGSAAFTGFEGGLIFIALKSFLGISGISMGLLGGIVGGLIFVQYRRFIEGKDLPIIAGITLALMLIPALRVGLELPLVMVVGVLAGAGAIAATALFRLIYLLLSRLL